MLWREDKKGWRMREETYYEAVDKISSVGNFYRTNVPWWLGREIYLQGIDTRIHAEDTDPTVRPPRDIVTYTTGDWKQYEVPVDSITPDGKRLFEHQVEAIQYFLWMYDMPMVFRGALLGDEMGLGKTISAIAFQNLVNPDVFVIVAPAHLVPNWIRELERWETTGKEIYVVPNTKDVVDLNKKGIYVFSYSKFSALWKKSKILLPSDDDISLITVFDESHYIKNPNSARTKAVMQYVQETNGLNAFHILMTGTFVKNWVDDLYVPWKLVVREEYEQYMQSIWTWRRRYTKMDKWHRVYDNANLDELTERFRYVLLRRQKKDVLNLPEKMYAYTAVDIPSSLAELLDEVYTLLEEGKSVKYIKEYFEQEKKITLQEILRQVAIAKMPQVLPLVKDVLDERGQVMLWVYHKPVAAQYAAALRDMDINVAVITGDVSHGRREQIIEEFQNGKYDVLIATVPAANTGYTITAAKTAIFVQWDFTPGPNRQAEDRIHRMGQDKDVLIYYAVAAYTKEEEFLYKWQYKEINAKQVYQEEANQNAMYNRKTVRRR